MEAHVASKNLVLIGGGHTHVLVLKALGLRPEPSVGITLIAKEVDAPYSGMLPGLVAGHYSHEDCHIDVARLARWAGVRLIHGAACGIDRAARKVLVEGQASVPYDLLSIDVGITPLLDGIAGAERNGIAVKPVSTFERRWLDLEEAARRPGGPRRIAVVGAGAAGFELVLALRHRLLTCDTPNDGRAFSFVLIGGSKLLPSHNSIARALARAALKRQSVELIESEYATAIEPGHVKLRSGRTIGADATLLSTMAGPAAWFKSSGLPLDSKGFIAVRPTFQLTDDDDVFAAGDCATVLAYPRDKAGVFAVRQGPPLTENLRRRARGEPAQPFRPQKTYLTLLTTGGRHAIAARNGLAISGDWVWRWKDKIDQDFMRQFRDLP